MEVSGAGPAYFCCGVGRGVGCYAAGIQVGDELGVGLYVGDEVVEGGGAIGEDSGGGEGLKGG